jgi:hypothetical protein
MTGKQNAWLLDKILTTWRTGSNHYVKHDGCKNKYEPIRLDLPLLNILRYAASGSTTEAYIICSYGEAHQNESKRLVIDSH